MNYRTSSSNITTLKDNEIFVFGSNESGRHGKGAAKTAMKWGAVYGQAEGLQGRTYAIPTVNATITNKLSLDKIKVYVDNFIIFAKQNKQLEFLGTPIGTGLAGWTVKDITPLFEDVLEVENIYMPYSFWKILRFK